MGGDMDTSVDSALDQLDQLAVALELAERTEDYVGAARIRDQLQEAEAARPMMALLWRRRQRVQKALDVALDGSMSLESRLEALALLKEMAMPPSAAVEAEDALHRLLAEVTGDGETAETLKIMGAAEEALWSVWHKSEDEEVDMVMKRGSELMERERFEEAIESFTEVIKLAPDFAEGWNKRATALFMTKEFEKSIDDCHKVLKLKPRHFGCLSGLGMCYRKLGKEEEAMVWLKKALEVHPALQGPQRLVLNAVVQEHLAPLIGDVVGTLSAGKEVVAEEVGNLSCEWDVNRVTPEDGASGSAHIYFFRVNIRNLSSSACPIKSLARFYVLKFADGHVFPFTRLTDGQASFSLQPGEEYKFCWALIVSRELQTMAGGVLLERQGQKEASQRYPRAGLAPSLLPQEAPEVQMKDLENLGNGYLYTGQLDLRQAAGL